MVRTSGAALVIASLMILAVACGQGSSVPPGSPTPARIPLPATAGPSALPSLAAATTRPAESATPVRTLTVQPAPAVTRAPAPTAPAGAATTAPTKPAGGGANTVVDRLIDMAKQDLSQRSSVPAGEIRVVSNAPVEWRDSSLGCPQPGGMYAQVITPGHRMVLEAAGNRYEYHSDSGSRVVYCPNP